MSDQNYRHVQRVWNKFNTVEYVSVYNITEVVQVLGVVVLKIMHGKFNLNPLDQVMLASFSWKCALKINVIELKLLIDVNMILDYENGIKGGITRAILHYIEAINKCMHCYYKSKESSYISHLDFNNRYGWALSQVLRLDEFQYVEDKS